MQKIRHVLRQLLTAAVVLMLVGMAPAPVFAADEVAAENTPTPTPTPALQNSSDDVPPTETQATAPSNGPTGPGAETFQYSSTTGLWQNDYYTYDPATGTMTPNVPLEYTYNNDTGMWDTLVWQFNTDTGAYEQVPLSVATDALPTDAITHGGPVPDSENNQPAAVDDSADVPASVGTESTTPDQDNDNTVTNTTGAALNNTIDATSQSGDVAATQNKKVGAVSSGDATATTTVVNQLQSQSSLDGGTVATFTANIQGDVSGDLVIDPANLAQNTAVDPTGMTNAQISNAMSGSITNNINLAATSGDATASGNRTVGSVTTGDANVLANVINMINSVVAANQSFVGTINIYGDYTGNILMPADSLNALLGSTGTISSGTAVDTSDAATIANNVDLSAASGAALADYNRRVGNVSSGSALTNLTILNLTGHQVTAANCLLVFVNVLGTWVGLILDAPAGTTSAAYGGGVTANTALPSGSNTTSSNNFGITNNITLAAASGDAAASHNRRVGDVSSGDATASANIANIVNSSFSLSNWFGILFINVFGSWHGNFGLVKPTPPVVPPITSGAALPPTTTATGSPSIGGIKAFAFVPASAGASGAGGAGSHGLGLSPVISGPTGSSSAGGQSGGDVVKNAGTVLAAVSHRLHAPTSAAVKQTLDQGVNYWSILLFTLGAAGFGVVGIERVRTTVRRKTTTSL